MIATLHMSLDRYIKIVIILILLSSNVQAQQSMQMQSQAPGEFGQTGQPCDERLSACTSQNDAQRNGYSSYDPNYQSYMLGTQSQYGFGNGQPYNLSSQGLDPTDRDQAQLMPVKLPPEPATEFQKFVAADLGK